MPDVSLERLRRFLEAGQFLSLREAAKRLGCSERHIRRLLERLRKEGLPVQSDFRAGRKHFFLPTEALRPADTPPTSVALSETEWAALAVAAQAAQSLLAATPHAAPLARALDRVSEKVGPFGFVFDFQEHRQPWLFDLAAEPVQVEHALWSALETAMLERRAVVTDYYTASRDEWTHGRRLHPLCFAYRDGAFVVVAWCTHRGAIRTFALSGFHGLRLVDTETERDPYFDPPDGFHPETFFRDTPGTLHDGQVEEIRLLVEKDRVEAFRRKRYHATQQIEEVLADGRAVVSFEAEGFESWRTFCQGWGVGVTVLAPERLRKRLGQEAKVLVKRYREESSKYQNQQTG